MTEVILTHVVIEQRAEESYPVSHTTRKYGLHDDAGTLASNDTKAESSPIIDKSYYFHLGPVGVQLQTHTTPSSKCDQTHTSAKRKHNKTT